MRKLLIVGLTALAGVARAGMAPDPTGLWYDPSESGWGLTLEQQDTTIFAVLFVYDMAGHPVWYVASDIVEPTDITPPAPPGGPFRGTLYRTSGPYFGGAFDPRAVNATPVGTLTIGYPDHSGQTLSVDYTVDGAPVTKIVQRQTFADQFASFSGVFQGAVVVQGAVACPVLSISPPDGTVTAFSVAPTFSTHQITMTWSTGFPAGCSIGGTYKQTGQFGSIAGTLSCGTITSPPLPTPIAIDGIDFNNGAFTARFRLQVGDCAYTGQLGGVRTGRIGQVSRFVP